MVERSVGKQDHQTACKDGGREAVCTGGSEAGRKAGSGEPSTIPGGQHPHGAADVCAGVVRSGRRPEQAAGAPRPCRLGDDAAVCGRGKG